MLTFIILFLVNAIKTINHIKEKREKLFLSKRLKEGAKLRKKEDAKLVETQMHLIRAPNGELVLVELMQLQHGNLKQLKASRTTLLSRWTLKWKTWKAKWRGNQCHPLPNVWLGRDCWLKSNNGHSLYRRIIIVLFLLYKSSSSLFSSVRVWSSRLRLSYFLSRRGPLGGFQLDC